MGIGIFVALLFLSKTLQLNSLYWVLDKATILGPVALVILLLPELRQAIEGFGRVGVWTQWLTNPRDVADKIQARTVEEIVAGVSEMSTRHIGAILVLERQAVLEEVVENGVTLGANVSAPLIVSIFYSNNPLHDGAVIVRGDTLVAAACRLPLSESRLDPKVHMRHRAAVGITEMYDCLAIVVSEERGTISVAIEGNLQVVDGASGLRDVLNSEWRRVKEAQKPRLVLFKGRTGSQ